MAMVPMLVNLARELDSDYCRSPMTELDHLFDDDFGFGIHPMDIFRPRVGTSLMMHPRRRHTPYDRQYQMLTKRGAAHRRSGGDCETGSCSQLMPTVTKDGFQVCMDVSQFKPNELTVKTVDKTVIVEGKHEEREDNHGMIQRHFVRKYTLPKDYDPKDVVSTISSDGVLTVKAPPPPNKAIKQNERVVQIQQTGPAHLSVKAPEQQQQQHQDQSQNGVNAQKMETGK